MKKVISGISLAIAICMAGCSTTGLSPREQGATNYNEMVYALSDQYSDDSLVVAQTTPAVPIRLGVAQIGETSPHELLLSLLRERTNLFSEIIEIPLMLGDEPYTQKIQYKKRSAEFRKLAKQLGATHLLMIGGHVDSRVVSSTWEIFDILVVPGFTVRSNEIFLEAKASAAFVETETGKVNFLLNVTAENYGKSPSFRINQNREILTLELREELSEEMVYELSRKLGRQ